MCQETNTAQGEAKCCICLDECCIFHTDKQGGALIDTLYFCLDARFLIELTTKLVTYVVVGITSWAIGLYIKMHVQSSRLLKSLVL